MKESRFIPGLVSVTFRQLSPQRIVTLAAKCGLSCIEWAGDVHVPGGDIKTARAVGEATREAGLSVCSYGSYFRIGTGVTQAQPFERIVETALALGAGNIRIWAGNRDTVESPRLYGMAVEEALAAAEIAHRNGLTVSYEMHAGSLTESTESCLRFLEETRHPAVHTLWQPTPGCPLEESLTGLHAIVDRLKHVHVFFWRDTRLPLSDGSDFWIPHLALLKTAATSPVPLLLEFVPDDDPDVLLQEASTLREWLES